MISVTIQYSRMNVSAGETVKFSMTVPLEMWSGSLMSKESSSWQTSEPIYCGLLSVTAYLTALSCPRRAQDIKVTKYFPGYC